MIFIKQKIKGVFLLKPEPYKDIRGSFRRHYCKKEFKKNGIISDISQCNVSHNKYKGTLRGFHIQKNPYGEAKTLSCFKGKIFDIVVDLRKKSKTYLHWVSFKLSEHNQYTIHIPKGCANAFLTLTDNCIIHYYCSNPYSPRYELGVRYNDPLFSFKWPIVPKIISQKDLSHKNFIK